MAAFLVLSFFVASAGGAVAGSCPESSADCDTNAGDESALLQSRFATRSFAEGQAHATRIAGSVQKHTSVVEHPKCCPGCNQTCNGNQCCMGINATILLTFPCPNAEPGWNQCELQMAPAVLQASVKCCPGCTDMCLGDQCCPGVAESNWETYPCPSASPSFNQCQGQHLLPFLAAQEPLLNKTVLPALVQKHASMVEDPKCCPGCSQTCNGNQCCTGINATNSLTFPCPNAEPGWNQCELQAAPAVLKASVKCCPGCTDMCLGDHCCPGVAESNWETYPCPSASPSFNQCQGQHLLPFLAAQEPLPNKTVLPALVQKHTSMVEDPKCCPGCSQTCNGNQCCTGINATNSLTFPCPNAEPGWNQCELQAAPAVLQASVKCCPGCEDMCLGNQCCPGVAESNWETYPCPSASPSFNQCHGPHMLPFLAAQAAGPNMAASVHVAR